jgi:hypothetical protein
MGRHGNQISHCINRWTGMNSGSCNSASARSSSSSPARRVTSRTDICRASPATLSSTATRSRSKVGLGIRAEVAFIQFGHQRLLWDVLTKTTTAGRASPPYTHWTTRVLTSVAASLSTFAVLPGNFIGCGPAAKCHSRVGRDAVRKPASRRSCEAQCSLLSIATAANEGELM